VVTDKKWPKAQSYPVSTHARCKLLVEKLAYNKADRCADWSGIPPHRLGCKGPPDHRGRGNVGPFGWACVPLHWIPSPRCGRGLGWGENDLYSCTMPDTRRRNKGTMIAMC